MSKALRALMEGLIDYAGMFPPAGLDMAKAAANYQSYLDGEYGWAVGRFIVPAAQLSEADPSWKVSVIGVPPRTWPSKQPPDCTTPCVPSVP